jgi:hypothetical protein
MAKAVTATDRRSEGRAEPDGSESTPAVSVLRRHRDAWNWVLGGLMSLATTVVYMIGSSRAIADVDSSVTVYAFVKTPSMLDPLRRTIKVTGMRVNNQPLFSLMEHAVWSLGGHSEAWLRVVPIIFAALAVGLLVAEASRLFGLLGGACAGLVLAANPMFAFYAREMRGYSLMTFAAVAATILLGRLLTSEQPRRWQEVAYVAALAAGLATHLWFVLLFVVHLVILLARREFTWRWTARLALGGVIGASVYALMISDMLGKQQGATFHQSFPIKSARLLLGHQQLAVFILGLAVIYGFVLSIRRRDIVAAVVTVAVLIGGVWVFIHPPLVPRYFMWFIPAFGLAIAVAVSRRPWIAALVLVAFVAMVVDQHSTWTVASPDTAKAAALVNVARAEQLRVCSYKGGNWAVVAYVPKPKPVQTVGLDNCDVLVEMRLPLSSYEKQVTQRMPYTWFIPGSNPVEVFSRVPIATLRANPASHLTLSTHSTTYKK